METNGRRRVAVIAVHGVADQQPGETATAIAGLLSNLEAETGRPAYSAFDRRELRVPVRRLGVPPHVAPGLPFAARARALRKAAAEGQQAHDIGFEFMTTVLATYEGEGPEATYDTTVLSAARGERDDDPAVDVYEMYWADLSRLTQSVFRIFAETYQLLFHMGSLGAHTVSAAQADESSVGTPAQWNRWATSQRFAANMMAIGTPILNLILFAIALTLVAQTQLREHSVPIAIALSGTMVAAGLAVLTYDSATNVKRMFPLALVVVAVTIALTTQAFIYDGPQSSPLSEAAMATQLWAIAIGGLALIARLYDRHRPGAWRAMKILAAAISAWLVAHLWWPGVTPMAALLDAGAVASTALAVSWTLYVLGAWVAVLTGLSLALSRPRSTVSGDRIRRAEWTACITLTVPGALFVVLTTLLWWGVWSVAGKRMTAEIDGTWLLQIFMRVLDSGSAHSASQIMESVIDSSIGWGLGVLTAGLGLAGLLAAYAFGPSAANELRPPEDTRDGAALGTWLDRGFRLWTIGGHLLWICVLVVLPIGFAAQITLPITHFSWVKPWADLNRSMFGYVSALVIPVGAGVMVFGNHLKRLTLGFRSVIDAALDVDNHLREHPLDHAPRARMAARYSSLLRHVYRQGYSKIVIIAHSQGSVMTADLLRYITTVASGPHADIVSDVSARPETPISFFTMGSPLRQLYGLRFPHLYGWARHEDVTSGPPAWPIAASTEPDPAPLGIATWINVYRSGDYIGRYLWRPDHCLEAYSSGDRAASHPWPTDLEPAAVVSVDDPPTRAEFCIGAGAHTHYWDRRAPDVGVTLDRLIRGE